MTTLDPLMHAGNAPAALARERAMLAHDIRGALQGVLGGVAVLDRADLAAELREQIDRVAAASKTLSCLIDAFVGQEMSPERRAGYQTVDLERFVAHLVRRWSGEARTSGVRFRVDVAPDAPAVLHANLILLARVLGNLIGNALRHGARTDVQVEVTRTAEGGLAFAVRDEGPGAAAATIDEVSRPLAGGASPQHGRGLGLQIVRRLCADIGGEFELRNRARGGVEARLSFPARLCEWRSPAGERVVAPAPRPDLSGVRVLLAEDNPTNQMVATQMLRALSADVTVSSDGVEALEKFEMADFDLVVVDIEMPRMTGLDVIRTIRGRRDGRSGVPIVALTAYAMREHREQISAAGANGLISKPITSVEALGSALRAHLPRPRDGGADARTTAADPSPAALDEVVADLAVFDALSSAIGEEMMAELLEKVVADLMQARVDLAGALSPLDRKPIRAASHILISVAGAIGAVRLQSCARGLNVLAHGEDGRSLPSEVRRCIEEIDAAVAFAESRRAGG